MGRLARGLLTVLALGMLAGCGGGETAPEGSPSSGPPVTSSAAPSPSGSTISPPGSPTSTSPGMPSGTPATITVTRTGGFAGVNQKLTVTPDGAWTYTADGKRETGRLTEGQAERLWSLAADSRLPAEAKHRDKRICADGYGYDLTVGSFSMTAVECGQFEDRPAFTALMSFLKDTTPL